MLQFGLCNGAALCGHNSTSVQINRPLSVGKALAIWEGVLTLALLRDCKAACAIGRPLVATAPVFKSTVEAETLDRWKRIGYLGRRPDASGTAVAIEAAVAAHSGHSTRAKIDSES